jgi:hypothetical protein
LLQDGFAAMFVASEGAMENEAKLVVKDGSSRPEAETTIKPDWTESEWFDVWLKLARREYEKAKN